MANIGIGASQLFGGSSGRLSGMTAGQIPVAATPTTVTSSIGTTGTGDVVLSTSPDITTPTFVGTITGGFNVTASPMAVFTGLSLPRTADLSNGWILDYQDEFAYANLVHGAVTTVTPTPTSGVTSSLFLNDSSYLDWATGAVWPIQITVDVSGSVISNSGNGTFAVGITFRSSATVNYSPTNIEIEFWDVTSGVWNVVYNQAVAPIPDAGQWISPALIAPPDDGYNISKVRVTLSGTNNPDSDIRIQRLMLYHATATWDPWHLSTAGGNVLGNINVVGGEYQVNGAALILHGVTGSIGGSPLLIGTAATGTVSITGASAAVAAGKCICVTPNTFPGAGFSWHSAYISASDTVTVQVFANVAGTPTASTYNVTIV